MIVAADATPATLGDIAVPGGPLRYDGTAAASTTPPPLLGEHEDVAWDAPWLDQTGQHGPVEAP